MTEDQLEARIERICIMVVENIPLEEAERLCDSMPWLYGKKDIVEGQEGLF